MALRIQEKTVQLLLKRHYTSQGFVVKREVKTPVGYIDHILYRDMGLSGYQKILVEVKEWSGIKHAIGQLISYEQYHKDCTELRIVYFCRDGTYRPVDAIHQTEQLKLQHNKLSIYSVTQLLDINDIIECQSKITNPSGESIESSIDSKSLSQDSTLENCTVIHPDESHEYLQELGILTGLRSENISF